MPELPTYTASGNVRGGPVASGYSAQTQTADAMVYAGAALTSAGRDAAYVANVIDQRKKENDFKAVNEASIALKGSLIAWERNPANQGREDSGEAYRQFADEEVAKVAKTLPSARAGELFKRSVAPSIQADWEKNLKIGEAVRFENFKAGQIAGATIDNEEYRSRALIEPEVAANIRSTQLTQRIASIQTVYGQAMPLQAQAMSERAVVDAVTGVMETDPALARGLLDKHQVVDPETRRILLGRIDQTEANARDTATFNELKLIENSIATGYEKMVPVPTPNKAVIASLPPNQQEKVKYDVAVANGTISKFSEVKGWNWQEQQRAISEIKIEGDPVAEGVKENLIKILAKSKDQQTSNPAGWQLANDPEFAKMEERISALPAEQRAGARMVELDRMIHLQGPPPLGVKPDQAKRYLNLPTGLQNVLSVDAAKTRAATFNNVPPNQLTKMVDDFNAEFPDQKLAAMAWNDMQNLPEGEGKLKMGVRVGTAINDAAVRNHFLGAMSNKEVLRTEDKKSEFDTELDGNETYRRFVSGWIGDGNQRGNELAEFRDSIARYAMSMSAGENLKTSKAVEKAVQRTIADNYIIANVNGSEVPIYRFDRDGRELFSERDTQAIQLGITNSLRSINVDSVSTDARNFPLAPQLPGDQTEANQYLKKAITSTGTVSIEPDGKSFTVYLKGQGTNDFPFQLRGVDGEPIQWQIETMKIRGNALLKTEDVIRSGSLKEQQLLQEQKRSEAERRLLGK